jgi:hypothetical protein
MRQARDPYEAPPAPRERGGPMLRFAIVAALLGAAAWGYMAFSDGPGLTEASNQEQTLAENAPPAADQTPETAPPPEATAPAPSQAEPTPQPQPVPPPSATTTPPA